MLDGIYLAWLQRCVPERGASGHQLLQPWVGLFAQVEAIDVAFRAEDADRGPRQRQAELCRRHPGVDVRGRDAVARRQRVAQRLHRRVVVDAVEGDEFREIGTQREIQPRDVAHGRRRQPVQLQRPPGLRVLRIHRAVHPDALDPDVVELVWIEAGDVVLVFVRHHQQVEPPLAVLERQQGLEVRDRAREIGGAAHRAAVDEHVKVVDGRADFPRLRDAAVDAVADLDVVRAD